MNQTWQTQSVTTKRDRSLNRLKVALNMTDPNSLIENPLKCIRSFLFQVCSISFVFCLFVFVCFICLFVLFVVCLFVWQNWALVTVSRVQRNFVDCVLFAILRERNRSTWHYFFSLVFCFVLFFKESFCKPIIIFIFFLYLFAGATAVWQSHLRWTNSMSQATQQSLCLSPV